MPSASQSAPNSRGPDTRKFFEPCAVLVGDQDSIFACGRKLGTHIISSSILCQVKDKKPSWTGISLKFAISGDAHQTNEQSGFGVRHACRSL